MIVSHHPERSDKQAIMRDFTLTDGRPVWIRAAEIDYFQAADDGTLIAFKDGRELLVNEDYVEVKQVLEAPTN